MITKLLKQFIDGSLRMFARKVAFYGHIVFYNTVHKTPPVSYKYSVKPAHQKLYHNKNVYYKADL